MKMSGHVVCEFEGRNVDVTVDRRAVEQGYRFQSPTLLCLLWENRPLQIEKSRDYLV